MDNRSTMNSILYKAVQKGQVDVLRRHIDQLDGLLTTINHNTLLHVAVQFGQLECTKVILQECPSLARRVNIKEETPLHMAAGKGYADIVKTLIECAKKLEHELESGWGGATTEMLRATNEDRDTALHMAVRNPDVGVCLKVVEVLIREDPEFQHPANSAKETPLYLAAKGRNTAVVYVLLEGCQMPSYSGPCDSTALHAAALEDSTGEIVKRLLEWKPHLIKEADVYGWIPIHYASYAGNEKGVKQLLKMDVSIASTTTPNEDGLCTALHIATTHGRVGVMKVLLSCCSDCWEAVNSRKQNVIHIAVDMERENVMNFILGEPWLTQLIDKQDNEGNTPSQPWLRHLISQKYNEAKTSLQPCLRHLINQKDNESNAPLHMYHVSPDVYPRLCYHKSAATRDVFNNKNRTPEELVECNLWEEAILFPGICGWRNIIRNTPDDLAKLKRAHKKQKEVEAQLYERFVNEVEKMGKSHMIIAIFVASITIGSAFAFLVGYTGKEGPEQGKTVLSRTRAFKSFVITIIIAITCSVSSILLYAYTSIFTQSKGSRKMVKCYVAAMYLVLVAIFSMMLAFIAAVLAVLAHSVALAIASSIIASITFVAFLVDLPKVFSLV